MRCRAFGLLIQSELRVPGAVDCADSGAAPDVEIVLGAAALVKSGARLGPWRGDRFALLLEAEGVAKYLCELGGRVVVEPAPGAREYDVLGLLIASALPALLWMRGDFALHACAVVMPGRSAAIAIAGRSGAGKSTVLRELIAAGARVVGEDVLRLRVANGVAEIRGLSSARFEVAEHGVPGGDRIEIPIPSASRLESADLAAVFTLTDRGAAGPPAFDRLDALASVGTLLAMRHRPRVPRLLGLEAFCLETAAALARHPPMYAWRRVEGETTLNGDEIDFLRRIAP